MCWESLSTSRLLHMLTLSRERAGTACSRRCVSLLRTNWPVTRRGIRRATVTRLTICESGSASRLAIATVSSVNSRGSWSPSTQTHAQRWSGPKACLQIGFSPSHRRGGTTGGSAAPSQRDASGSAAPSRLLVALLANARVCSAAADALPRCRETYQTRSARSTKD